MTDRLDPDDPFDLGDDLAGRLLARSLWGYARMLGELAKWAGDAEREAWFAAEVAGWERRYPHFRADPGGERTCGR